MDMTTQTEVRPELPHDLVQRIYDAHCSGKMNDCESDILHMLVDMRSGGALQIGQMQCIWNISGQHVWTDRHVKASVKALIETHGIPVCSSRHRIDGGYYLAVETRDLEAAERPLRGEIISLAKRLKAFNPNSQFARLMSGQLQIETESQQ